MSGHDQAESWGVLDHSLGIPETGGLVPRPIELGSVTVGLEGLFTCPVMDVPCPERVIDSTYIHTPSDARNAPIAKGKLTRSVNAACAVVNASSLDKI